MKKHVVSEITPKEIRRFNKMKKEIKENKEEVARLKDQLLRKMAEFDNYRKRTEREFSDLIVNANTSFVKELLPIVDDLSRSIESAETVQDIDDYNAGIRMIYEKFMKILEARGVRPFDAVGENFDTEKHEAIMQIEKQDQPSNAVVEEYEKGYIMNDRVIRHAKVIVNK